MKPTLSEKNMLQAVQYILTEYYNLNYNPLLSVLAQDCVWIHPSRFLIIGAEAIKKVCDDNFGIPPLQLEDMQLELLNSGSPEQLTVCGSYFVYSDENLEIEFSEKQRITMLFRRENDDFKLYHLHVSNECMCLSKEQNCPVQISRQAYYYVQKILQEKAALEQCHITCRIAIETDKGTHCIDPELVQYVEAMGKTCVVYMLDRTVEINKPFSTLENILPKCFYRIHRSYLVNCNYVTELKRYTVKMLSGAELPIPTKRYAEVKQAVTALMQTK